MVYEVTLTDGGSVGAGKAGIKTADFEAISAIPKIFENIFVTGANLCVLVFMKNFIAILISVISLTPLAAHAQWMQTSLPDIGDVTALTIDGSNILAGSIVGTIYCSSDSGTNWTLSFNNTDQHEVHNFILLGDKIITSCMGQGLFLSQDSGARWLNINSDLPYESAVAFAFKRVIFLPLIDYYNSSGDHIQPVSIVRTIVG